MITGTIMDMILLRIRAAGVEVHDLRGSLPRNGPYPKTTPGALLYTAVHYTATVRQPASLETEKAQWSAHARYHVSYWGWPGIAYAIGVSLSGRVFILHEIEDAGAHAYGANFNGTGIAVDMGDGQDPTPAALKSLGVVLHVLHKETPELPRLTAEDTYGHQELTFLDVRNVTLCPGRLLPYVQQYRRTEGDIVDLPVTVTFPTGITMNTTYGFYQYWSQNGDVPVFGYPISDEIQEDTRTVQYFERARLELNPDGSISRGLVGREAHDARYKP